CPSATRRPSFATASTRPAWRPRPRRRRRVDPRSLPGARLSAARGRPCPGPARVAAPRAFVFDAYGTLFDVHSVVEAARALTSDPQALSQLWRQKQLEYTWLRSLMGRYQDFWLVTGQALRFALRRLGITAAESQIEALMSAYLTLSPFPEVPNALRALRGRPL